MQIMPHWILRSGVRRVEEDGEVMVKYINLYYILSKKRNIPYQDCEVLSSSSALLDQLADFFETFKKFFWKQLTRGWSDHSFIPCPIPLLSTKERHSQTLGRSNVFCPSHSLFICCGLCSLVEPVAFSFFL